MLTLSPRGANQATPGQTTVCFLQLMDGPSPWTPFPHPPSSHALWGLVSLGVTKC